MHLQEADRNPCSKPEPEADEAVTGAPTSGRLPWQLWHRLKRRPIVLLALAVGAIGGPLFASVAFPEAPMAKQLLGGWIAGFFFALCTVPEHFLDL